jgi:hypothetical protein
MSKEEKGKEPQDETTIKEPLEGTSTINTIPNNIIFETLLELDKAKVDLIKWKRVI